MNSAHTIVSAIVRDIESRIDRTAIEQTVIDAFTRSQEEIGHRVGADCRSDLPPVYADRLNEILGPEFMETLNQGRGSTLGRRNRERYHYLLTRLARFVDSYRFYVTAAQQARVDAACLEQIKHELMESQVAQLQEIETLELRLQRCDLLLDVVLLPFEQAMQRVMTHLDAQQIEIFLFDDDQFLASELKTDGQSFIYNCEEESAAQPTAVSEIQFTEIQETSVDVPLVVEGTQIGHYRIRRAITPGFDKTVWQQDVECCTPVVARIIEANRNQLLSRKVYIDDLTGLYNKRKLNEQMGKLFKQFKQGRKQLHIAMLDIDHFKKLNDTHGHPVGDQILTRTAHLIREEVPYAYRYGGEEFVAVFYGYELEQCLAMLEQVRSAIEQAPFAINGASYPLTISIGLATFETWMHSVMDAVDRADQALYVSKQDGRNRCTYYNDVEGRLTDDMARLRQENLQLREEAQKYRQLQMEYEQLEQKLKKKTARTG